MEYSVNGMILDQDLELQAFRRLLHPEKGIRNLHNVGKPPRSVFSKDLDSTAYLGQHCTHTYFVVTDWPTKYYSDGTPPCEKLDVLPLSSKRFHK